MLFLNMLPSEHLGAHLPSLPSQTLSICHPSSTSSPREVSANMLLGKFLICKLEGRREEKSPQHRTPQWGGHSLLGTIGTSSLQETERIKLQPDLEKLRHLWSLPSHEG